MPRGLLIGRITIRRHDCGWMVLGDVTQEKPEHREHHNKDGNHNQSAHEALSPPEVEAFRSFPAAVRLSHLADNRLRTAGQEKTHSALSAAVRSPAQSTMQPITPVRAVGAPNIRVSAVRTGHDLGKA
jgi:hypothetical protein